MGIAARKTALARFGQGRFVSEFVQLLTKSSVLAGE
jgi:hypothetical protein